MLKFSSIFSLIQVAFFLQMLWILYLVNYFCFISTLICVVFFLALSSEINSCIFILLNLFCVYEIRWNSCILQSRRHVLVLRLSLYSLHLLSGFGVRAGFDMNTSHMFPQVMLAAINLVGSGARDGGARASARCELGLLLWSVAVTDLLRVRSCPITGAEALGSWVWAGSIPFKCVFSPSQHLHS